MDAAFRWIEESAFSTFLRESPSLWVFPFILILHTWGLAFAMGVNVLVDVRVLGLGRGVTPATLDRYSRVMWAGFWVNAFSGVLLLTAYPTKALTNPVFYAKLVLIAIALVLYRRLGLLIRAADDPAARLGPAASRLALVSLACWAAAVFAGRFLAYTHSRLLVDTVA